METITEDNGLMDKKKVEASKSTMKKAIDIKANGRLIYQMDRVKLLTGTVHITLVDLRIIIGMERDNIMIFRIKRQSNNFIKMAFLFNKKQNQCRCRKSSNSQHWFWIKKDLIVRIYRIFRNKIPK